MGGLVGHWLLERGVDDSQKNCISRRFLSSDILIGLRAKYALSQSPAQFKPESNTSATAECGHPLRSRRKKH
jgi:hypothetical protein